MMSLECWGIAILLFRKYSGWRPAYFNMFKRTEHVWNSTCLKTQHVTDIFNVALVEHVLPKIHIGYITNHHVTAHMGQCPQDGNWPWVMSFFFKVWKNAVTKPEEQTLFFQLFMRYLFTWIIRKKVQVTLTPLHYTTLHYNIPLYTTLH